MQQQTNWGIFKLILWAVIQLGTFKMFWNEGKEKMEIPEGMGGLHKPLWNGNSEGMGGVKKKNLSWGGYVYFMEIHIMIML